MSDLSQEVPELTLEAAVEALLFVAASPVTVGQLAEATGHKTAEVEQAIRDLEQLYSVRGGLRLQWHAGKVQMTSAPEAGTLIEKFLGLEATSRLSRAALEALTIIAYRQPITRPGVDAIRGVSSDGVLKSLLNKGLVEEMGRAEGPGRPILYGTTADFLQFFGLNSLRELPPFESPEMQPVENKLLKD